MILNSIRMYRTDFNQEFGEIVLTYDSKHYWRRDYFLITKLVVKRVEKTIVKIGMQFLIVSIKLNQSSKRTYHTNMLRFMVQRQMMLSQHYVNIFQIKKL